MVKFAFIYLWNIFNIKIMERQSKDDQNDKMFVFALFLGWFLGRFLHASSARGKTEKIK